MDRGSRLRALWRIHRDAAQPYLRERHHFRCADALPVERLPVLSGDTPTSSPTVTFRLVTGVLDGAPVWGVEAEEVLVEGPHLRRSRSAPHGA